MQRKVILIVLANCDISAHFLFNIVAQVSFFLFIDQGCCTVQCLRSFFTAILLYFFTVDCYTLYSAHAYVVALAQWELIDNK